MKSASAAVEAWKVDVKFQREGSYQWIYFERGGTFSFKPSTEVEYVAYAAEDLTNPLRQDGMLDPTQLPPSYLNALDELGITPGPADTFAMPNMSLLRVRANRATVGENFIGSGRVWIIKHKGDSPETAILLKHDELCDPELPAGQPLSPTSDLCWFRAILPGILAPTYTSTLTLFNDCDPRLAATLTVRPPAAPFNTQTGSDAELAVQHVSGGNQAVFLTLERADVNQVKFKVLWQTGKYAVHGTVTTMRFRNL